MRLMRPYLENEVLQRKVLDFVRLNKIIGAICHGPIVLARTLDPATGKSVIYNKRITALPKILERTAYYLTFWKHGKYYRTDLPGVCSGRSHLSAQRKTPVHPGPSPNKPFVVEDGNLITARWPLDAHLFAETLIRKLD